MWAFSFSFFHMVMMGTSPSSLALVDSKASSVSIRIWRTEGSLPDRSSSLEASMNFLSMWRVNPGPGLSARMRMSMMALYWHEAFESRDMNLRIRRAHWEAASGEATAASTMEGRKMTSSPCGKVSIPFLMYQVVLFIGHTEALPADEQNCL